MNSMPGSPQSSESTDINPEINIDFEENFPFQGNVISEIYQRPDKSLFQEPQQLDSLINAGNLVQKFLPKLIDIDKILKGDSKESSQRYTLSCHSKRHIGRLHNQPLLQVHLSVFSSEYIA